MYTCIHVYTYNYIYARTKKRPTDDTDDMPPEAARQPLFIRDLAISTPQLCNKWAPLKKTYFASTLSQHTQLEPCRTPTI